MPWNVVLSALVVGLAGGCLFDADYSGGSYRCSDGECPSGLVCDTGANRCVPRIVDGAVDGPSDVPTDVPLDTLPSALTCADPGPLSLAGGTASGTTAGRSFTISATCAGTVMNGRDAVYKIDATVGAKVLVSITGLKAYVISPCALSPATPPCLTNLAAAPGNPISITFPTTGAYFVVVDHESPATSGSYTLIVAPQ